jgi:hypothetical protein
MSLQGEKIISKLNFILADAKLYGDGSLVSEFP